MTETQFSIVIPTFNELDSSTVNRNINEHGMWGDTEILVIEGGLEMTNQPILSPALRLIRSPKTNRAQRIKVGIRESKGTWVVVVHPRSFLSRNALSQVELACPTYLWGGWTHKFDDRHPILKWTSWYSNVVRARMRSIFYLDHCWFFKRNWILSYLDEFSEADLFEDTDICMKLRQKNSGGLLPGTVETSSVRFRRNGFFKHAIKNQYVKLRYLLGSDLSSLARYYEKRLNLNGFKEN
jgi:hypothetical protein